MHTAGSADSFVSPFEFMQAAGVLLKDGDGRSVNGEREMDAEEFYGLLLRQLEDEEVNGRSSHTNPPSPTVVETLLGSSTADLVSHCQTEFYECSLRLPFSRSPVRPAVIAS